MPRWTLTPISGTSANFTVLFMPEKIACGEVFAHLGLVHVEGGGELDVRDVVAAQVHVHEPGHELAGLRFPVVVHPLHER